MCRKQEAIKKDRMDVKKNPIECPEPQSIIIKAKTSGIREFVIRHQSEEVTHPKPKKLPIKRQELENMKGSEESK